jgi:pre-mRNA cleavage complex 2 protein Pcf11
MKPSSSVNAAAAAAAEKKKKKKNENVVVQSEIAEDYGRALEELQQNSKPIITSLTMLAKEIGEKDERSAREIAEVILRRIDAVRDTPKIAIAVMYVLDSCAKNCREPYADIFNESITNCFTELFENTLRDEKTRTALKKLMKTWETQEVFARDVLDVIFKKVDLIEKEYMKSRAPPPPPPHQQQHLHHQHQQHQLIANTSSNLQQRVPPPPPQQQQQFNNNNMGLLAGGMPVVLPDLSNLLNTLKAQQQQQQQQQQQLQRPPTPDLYQDHDYVDAEESLKKFKKDPKALNKRREYLILALYDDLPFKCAQTGRRFASKESLDQHMDWLHAKRRRKKSGRAMRGWHVSAKEWIKGTIKMGEVEPEFDAFAKNASGGRDKDNEKEVGVVIDENLDLNDLPSVPVDETQKKCALSGEPFETFWNEKAQEWHYGKAVKLKRAFGSKKVKAGEIALISAIPKEEFEIVYDEILEAIRKLQPRNASTKVSSIRESRSKRAKK